jgi:hypothetical protein
MYDYKMKSSADNLGEDYFSFLEKHLKILQSNNINALYFAVSHSAKTFDKHLALFKTYGIKIIPQLDLYYFLGNESNEQLLNKARSAADFINKYKDRPEIIAWSVKEEVSHKDVNLLANYYSMILKFSPDTKFVKIDNNIGAATDAPMPNPAITGTDRYAFWWEWSGGGYSATPAFSLEWLRGQAKIYSKEAAKRNADFMWVITQGGWTMPGFANRYCRKEIFNEYSKKLPEKLRNKGINSIELAEKCLALAETEQRGWAKFNTAKGVRYNVWKYYRLPENCLKATGWTGILEGARLFFCWSYVTDDKKKLTFESASYSDIQEIGLFTLAGHRNCENPQLKEFGEFGKNIRRYEKIITKMSKLDNTPITTEKNDLFFNAAFKIPNQKGTVIVIHNANVGTWSGGTSKRWLSPKDDFRIDRKGNLIGYHPFTKPRKCNFTVNQEILSSGKKLYNIGTGKMITGSGNQFTVNIMPGSGEFIFIGFPQDAKKILKLMK